MMWLDRGIVLVVIQCCIGTNDEAERWALDVRMNFARTSVYIRGKEPSGGRTFGTGRRRLPRGV